MSNHHRIWIVLQGNTWLEEFTEQAAAEMYVWSTPGEFVIVTVMSAG